MTGNDLNFPEVEKVIQEIAELKPGWVIVEGGEPLLHENIFDILKRLKDEYLNVYLITNGTMLNAEKIQTLKQLEIKVMVSIDSADPKVFEELRRGAKFGDVVQKAKDCAEAGILDTVNTVVSKLNYRELPQILDLVKSIGANKSMLLGLKPCKNYSANVLSPEDYGEAIKLAAESAMKTGVEIFFDEPFFHPAIEEWGLSIPNSNSENGILVSETPGCIIGEYIFIEPNGDVKPCTFAPLVIGNVKEKGLAEIWKDILSSEFLNRLRDPATRTGHCQSCPYLRKCKGCRSRTFTLTSDWFGTDPVCPIFAKSTFV
jgi:radical SAM protein with 4Fe4S-binding SPASM domain